MKIFARIVLAVVTVVAATPCVMGFDTDSYARESVLAKGRWVKVQVSTTGMHLITNQTLSQWGFKTPSKVRIHGYGGAMLSDVLSPEEYRDDLPLVASQVTSRGVAFYAVGPVQVKSDGKTLSHSVNPYSSYGFYYLTEADDSDPTPQSSGSALSGGSPATMALALLVHEQETSSPGKSGRLMVGEDFNYTRSRTFPFTLTDRVESEPVTIGCSFVAKAFSSSTISFTVNGSTLPTEANDRISASNNDSKYWGNQTVTTKTATPSGTSLNLGLTFSCSGTVSSANLDYLTVQYTRRLTGTPDFFSSSSDLRVEGAGASGTHVWDVTDPVNARSIPAGQDGGWRADASGVRHYAVWTETQTLPQPTRVGAVSNQNLHGLEVPDMVIVTPSAYMDAARTIADLHHNHPLDTLRVEVVDQEQIFNEFGSGAFDPGAIRRFFKMLYDRDPSRFRYALLMGKGTFDNRKLTSIGKANRNASPLWISESSLQANQSFSTDDYFGMLTDYDGQRPAREDLEIAVGRIPCTTTDEAATAADKIKQYIYSMPRGDWRNKVTILADDENSGVHMTQAEAMVNNMLSTEYGSRRIVNKVYCDAYERQNSTYPKAKTDLFRSFADGTGVFCFIGHGSPTALGSKIIIGPTEFRSEFFLRRLPFFYAATCDFLQWDNDITSMAETLFFQSDGGMISCISALRPVFISNNGNLSASFGSALGKQLPDGSMTIGELYRLAKNGTTNDTNKMRYVLMGDPALRLSVPESEVRLETINGQVVDEQNTMDLAARQKLTLEGTVRDIDGNVIEDFNGNVTATLYDSEYSTTSNGWGDGEQVVFEQNGEMLFTTGGIVKDGHFTVTVTMPSQVSGNYRPATLSFYAAPSDKNDLRQAMGVSRNVYAYGYDESAEADTEAPLISSFYINTSDFQNGDKVNTDPLVVATISDNTGINLSSAGVGRLMTLTLDDNDTRSDLSRSFTVDATPTAGAMSGSLAYQLSNLSAGEHTMRLRVWDIADNYTEQTLTFTVAEGLAPEIYKVYTDASPARTQAGFYITHNRPDAVMNVKVTVYNLQGREVWSASSQSRSDMNVTSPLIWDLKDHGGHRVQRGIYIYRAEISTDGETYTTKSQKLAVAGI